MTERCANLESQVVNWQSLLMTMQKTQLDQALEIKALQDSLTAVKKGVKAAAPKDKTFEEILDDCNYTEKEKEVLTVLNDFCIANSWEEKREFVIPDEDVLIDMKKKYPKGSGRKFKPQAYAFVGVENATEGNVVRAILVSYGSSSAPWYLVKTKEGYKIDYAASFNLTDEQSLKNYRSNNITTPMDVRFYAHKFSPARERDNKSLNNYGVIECKIETRDYKLYVSQSDPAYRVLKASIEDSNHNHCFILKVAWDPKLGEYVVKKVIKNGTWSYYDKDK